MTDSSSMESTKMTYIRNEQGHYVCPECDVVKVKQNTMHYHMTKCRLKNKPVEERPLLDGSLLELRQVVAHRL